MRATARRRAVRGLALAVAALLCRAAGAQDERPPAEPRWLVGDLHVHVSPPDGEGHSALTVDSAVRHARLAGLDFIVVTPHGADAPAPGGGDGQDLVRRLAAEVPSTQDGKPARPVMVVAGWEWTRESPGHLGIAFADVSSLSAKADSDRTRAALDAGGLVTVNHPFLRPVPSDVPVLARLRADRSWRPWIAGEFSGRDFNAVEVWHDRSALIEALHRLRADRFPETQMIGDALRAWDRVTREQRRRIVAVGGSDAHGRTPYTIRPTAVVSVRVDTADEDGLRRGLLAARVTFGRDGGASAREFTATSDVEGARAAIGDSVRAHAEVRLTWHGEAALFEDGEPVGTYDGGAVRPVDPPGSFHSWRIEKPRHAFTNCIYANLPE